jgi:hypothetical protein
MRLEIDGRDGRWLLALSIAMQPGGREWECDEMCGTGKRTTAMLCASVLVAIMTFRTAAEWQIETFGKWLCRSSSDQPLFKQTSSAEPSAILRLSAFPGDSKVLAGELRRRTRLRRGRGSSRREGRSVRFQRLSRGKAPFSTWQIWKWRQSLQSFNLGGACADVA